MPAEAVEVVKLPELAAGKVLAHEEVGCQPVDAALEVGVISTSATIPDLVAGQGLLVL